MEFIDVEFLVILFWLYKNKHQFKLHVLLDGSTATGEGFGFTVVSEASERGIGRLFCQFMPSAKNRAKLDSNDTEYCKFCHQASNVVIDLCLVSDHCLGAQLVFMVIGTLVCL